MCFLQCIDVVVDAIVDAWHDKKIKRKAKLEKRKEKIADQFNRDDINVPVIVEEKRCIVVSDPGLEETGPSIDHRRLSVREDTIITMKKVSSLALV